MAAEVSGVQGVVSGWVLVGLGFLLGDGCRGTHGQYRGGGKPGILLSNSSRPGGLER